jgi:adenylate cyclase class 2
MSSNKEIEVKFRIGDLRQLNQRLRQSKFRLVTKRTHEVNTLFDLPGQVLRKRGELLRLRQYGDKWILTHKAKGVQGRHKVRIENETEVADGRKMEVIIRALGFEPTFRYEKYRAEWSDGNGHVVVDETPIGNFGEIEGGPRWIDRTAKALQISREDYITFTYADLFFQWKAATKSSARNMTFAEAKAKRRRS